MTGVLQWLLVVVVAAGGGLVGTTLVWGIGGLLTGEGFWAMWKWVLGKGRL